MRLAAAELIEEGANDRGGGPAFPRVADLWPRVYQLPTYAPELNPIEAVYSHLKRSLANLAKRNLAQLGALGQEPAQTDAVPPGLIGGFLVKTGLDLAA